MFWVGVTGNYFFNEGIQGGQFRNSGDLVTGVEHTLEQRVVLKDRVVEQTVCQRKLLAMLSTPRVSAELR